MPPLRAAVCAVVDAPSVGEQECRHSFFQYFLFQPSDSAYLEKS